MFESCFSATESVTLQQQQPSKHFFYYNDEAIQLFSYQVLKMQVRVKPFINVRILGGECFITIQLDPLFYLSTLAELPRWLKLS